MLISNMDYDENNIFAKILKKELPAKVVYENEFVLSFYDIYPNAETHVLVIPKMKFMDFEDFTRRANKDIQYEFWCGVNATIDILGLENGFRLITNKGSDGNQLVFHFHIHILGGKIYNFNMMELATYLTMKHGVSNNLAVESIENRLVEVNNITITDKKHLVKFEDIVLLKKNIPN